MGIMDVIKKISANKKEKSEKFKQMQEQDRLETMLIERKKSSNLRAVEKYYKDQEEKKVKIELDRIRHRQTKDSWKGDSILKSGKSILHEDTKILSNDRPILGQKNIFLDNKSHIPISKERLFFKW